MYSSSVEKILKKNNIAVGDRIHVESEQGTFEGLLMPRTYESEIIVLKLDNGYNIGIKLDAKTSGNIKLLAKSENKKEIKEIEQHHGEIAILGCGGTIASKIEYKTGAVFPAISPQELRATFPSIENIATIHTKQLFHLFSEDISSKHWQVIADAIAKEIKENVNGVVLMHGTDMMHYSAAAISFMLQNLPVPVIFVGAQRSSDRPSSENKMNMLNAVFAAKQDVAEVSVCMHASTNDDFCYLHRGVRARKFHTSRRDAFKSVNSKPLAVVDHTNNKFDIIIDGDYRKRDDSNKTKLKIDTRMNENVAMIYAHPNLSPKFIAKLSDFDGVVILGTGLGHVSTNPFEDKNAKAVLPEVKSLIDSGIPVVMAPQAIFGRVDMKVYTTGRLLSDAGVIGDGCDWTAETAFCKLSWVLGHTKDMKKIKEEMLTNFAGELSERSPLDFELEE